MDTRMVVSASTEVVDGKTYFDFDLKLSAMAVGGGDENNKIIEFFHAVCGLAEKFNMKGGE